MHIKTTIVYILWGPRGNHGFNYLFRLLHVLAQQTIIIVTAVVLCQILSILVNPDITFTTPTYEHSLAYLYLRFTFTKYRSNGFL